MSASITRLRRPPAWVRCRITDCRRRARFLVRLAATGTAAGEVEYPYCATCAAEMCVGARYRGVRRWEP